MAIKKRMRDGTIKYITFKHEEDNEKVPSETLTEKDNTKKDLEIKRLEAIVQLLEDRIKQLEANKSSEPQEIEAAPIESYAMYC